jgi:uncharacterized protein
MVRDFSKLAALLVFLAANLVRAADFPVVELSSGIHRVEAEVAYTEQARELGLMHRTAMPAYHGMLFVFPKPVGVCMWMRNTLLPLSVAFIDGDGKIINIEDMQPQTDTNHCAAKPARYALEMNLHWFKTRGLGSGSAIAGLEHAPAAQ